MDEQPLKEPPLAVGDAVVLNSWKMFGVVIYVGAEYALVLLQSRTYLVGNVEALASARDVLYNLTGDGKL